MGRVREEASAVAWVGRRAECNEGDLMAKLRWLSVFSVPVQLNDRRTIRLIRGLKKI